MVFTRNDQKKGSNQNNIAILPVAKSYVSTFCWKNCKKNIATLTQVAPDDQSRNEQKNMVKAVWPKKWIIVFYIYIYMGVCLHVHVYNINKYMYTLQNSIQPHAFSAFRLSNSMHVNWHLLPRWHSKGRRSPLNAPSICDRKDQLLASRLWRLLPQLKLNLLKFWKGPYTLSGDAVRVVLEKVWTW